MGEENLDDKIENGDYLIAITGLNVLYTYNMQKENYEVANIIVGSWKRLTDAYIDFRLDKYDGEGRKVIRETYKILGYNPNKPLMIR